MSIIRHSHGRSSERRIIADYSDLDFILRYRVPSPSLRILDCGCEDGGRSLALAFRGYKNVTGIDRSANNIAAARQRASKRAAEVRFLQGEPRATPFADRAFDEVLLLGKMFGHGEAARADVELLIEMQRILTPEGMLWVGVADGDWIRENYEQENIETLPQGFIHRRRRLIESGNCLETHVLISDETLGVSTDQTFREWLYGKKQMTTLLHQLGFEAISYHTSAPSRWVGAPVRVSTPRFLVHCLAPYRRHNALRVATAGQN